MKPCTRFILSLGSNLGDRLAHLERGVRDLSSTVSVEAVSRIVESPVWAPAPPQPDFLNLVLRGRTSRDARSLLELARAVESSAGRVRTIRGGARTLDVDIIFFGTEVIDSAELRVPHPRWSDRPFVSRLVPEVAGDMVDPATGRELRGLTWPDPLPTSVSVVCAPPLLGGVDGGAPSRG